MGRKKSKKNDAQQNICSFVQMWRVQQKYFSKSISKILRYSKPKNDFATVNFHK
jgi:hypothetical protein